MDSQTPGNVDKIEEREFDCFACASHLVKGVLVTIRGGMNVSATKYFNPTDNEEMVEKELDTLNQKLTAFSTCVINDQFILVIGGYITYYR